MRSSGSTSQDAPASRTFTGQDAKESVVDFIDDLSTFRTVSGLSELDVLQRVVPAALREAPVAPPAENEHVADSAPAEPPGNESAARAARDQFGQSGGSTANEQCGREPPIWFPTLETSGHRVKFGYRGMRRVRAHGGDNGRMATACTPPYYKRCGVFGPEAEGYEEACKRCSGSTRNT
ncbi:hypothetical protein MTO96_031434 [Rhipicephalus appendiculatus]